MKNIFLCLSLLCSIFIGVNHSHAERKTSAKGNSDQKRQVLQTIKQIEQAQKKLARQFKSLSAAAKTDVIARTSSKINSDDDLLNDYLEGALKLNKCSNDSDEDGRDDDDEYGDDDSSDDGSSDDGSNDDGSSGDNSGVPFEVHKRIQAIDSTSVLLDGVSYVINQQTKLMDDNKNIVSISFFSVGKCVEAEGHVSGGSKIIKKLKEDDDC